MQDPQSLHKYADVHGDPIQGTDPTGLFGSLSVAGFSAASMVQGALRGMAIGGVTGAVTGAADAWLGGGDSDDIRDAAMYGGMAGAVLGLFTGGIAGPAATGFSSLSVVARVRILKSLIALNLAASGYGVYQSNTASQGAFRATLGFIGTLGLLRAVQVARVS